MTKIIHSDVCRKAVNAAELSEDVYNLAPDSLKSLHFDHWRKMYQNAQLHEGCKNEEVKTTER